MPAEAEASYSRKPGCGGCRASLCRRALWGFVTVGVGNPRRCCVDYPRCRNDVRPDVGSGQLLTSQQPNALWRELAEDPEFEKEELAQI